MREREGIVRFTDISLNSNPPATSSQTHHPRYNPQDISRTATLLQGGTCMGRRFQPYEAHIPFLLQVKVRELALGVACFWGLGALGAGRGCWIAGALCTPQSLSVPTHPLIHPTPQPPQPTTTPYQIDFNLLGMGHLELSRLLFRDPLPPAPATQPPTPGSHPADADASYWRADGAVLSGSSTVSQMQLEQHGLASGGNAAAAAATGDGGALGVTLGCSQRPPAVVWNAATMPAEWSWSAAVNAPGSQLPRWVAWRWVDYLGCASGLSVELPARLAATSTTSLVLQTSPQHSPLRPPTNNTNIKTERPPPAKAAALWKQTPASMPSSTAPMPSARRSPKPAPTSSWSTPWCRCGRRSARALGATACRRHRRRRRGRRGG